MRGEVVVKVPRKTGGRRVARCQEGLGCISRWARGCRDERARGTKSAVGGRGLLVEKSAYKWTWKHTSTLDAGSRIAAVLRANFSPRLS